MFPYLSFSNKYLISWNFLELITTLMLMRAAWSFRLSRLDSGRSQRWDVLGASTKNSWNIQKSMSLFHPPVDWPQKRKCSCSSCATLATKIDYLWSYWIERPLSLPWHHWRVFRATRHWRCSWEKRSLQRLRISISVPITLSSKTLRKQWRPQNFSELRTLDLRM